jgi:hypothetical protein
LCHYMCHVEKAFQINSVGFICPASAPMGQIGVIEERRISGSS